MKLFESLQNEIKSFEDETSYINFFDLSECDLYHIQNNPEKDYVELTNVRKLIETINEKGEAVTGLSGIKKKNIDDMILKSIEQEEIVSLIVYQKKILYLDESSRSMIAQKTKCSGLSLYDKSITADIILQANMQTYVPAGKNKKKYPVAVIRQRGKSLILAAVLSNIPASVSQTIEKEMEDKNLSLYSFERTAENFTIVFDGKEIDGYIPSIIVDYSDTGNGNKKKLAIRPIGAKTPIPLKEVEEEDYDLEVYLRSVKQMISSKTHKIVKNPVNTLLMYKGFEAIGKGRIKKFFNPEALKLPEDEFYKCILAIPDKIGKVNRTADYKFLTALGNSFKMGVI